MESGGGHATDRTEYGIKLSVRGVGNYLSRWGFTPLKAIKKAYEQRPEAVQAWLNQEYPQIEKRAKAEGGEIRWGDETALVNDGAHHLRGQADNPRIMPQFAAWMGGSSYKWGCVDGEDHTA